MVNVVAVAGIFKLRTCANRFLISLWKSSALEPQTQMEWSQWTSWWSRHNQVTSHLNSGILSTAVFWKTWQLKPSSFQTRWTLGSTWHALLQQERCLCFQSSLLAKNTLNLLKLNRNRLMMFTVKTCNMLLVLWCCLEMFLDRNLALFTLEWQFCPNLKN